MKGESRGDGRERGVEREGRVTGNFSAPHLIFPACAPVHWPLLGGLLHLVPCPPPPRQVLAVPIVTVHPLSATHLMLYNNPVVAGMYHVCCH